MKTYDVHFGHDHGYSETTIKAKNIKAALAKAKTYPVRKSDFVAHYECSRDIHYICVTNEETYEELCWDRRLDLTAVISPARLLALGERLSDLANEIADFAQNHTERLDYGSYQDLCEHETRLLAYGNILESADCKRFLHDQIAQAEEHLAYMQQRISEELTG